MSNIIPLVLFGGSFDPIHRSHLWMANNVHQQLNGMHIQSEIRFLPTACSPFKDTQTSAKHRLSMLRLALRDTPFTIDKTEINSAPPNFTIDTLTKIRQRIGSLRPLYLYGTDSLENLPRWKGGYDLLEKAHLWIFPRINDGLTNDLALPADIQNRQIFNTEELNKKPNGFIYLDKNNPPALSSSQVRQHSATSELAMLLKKSLPSRVLAYNRKTKLYYGLTSPYES